MSLLTLPAEVLDRICSYIPGVSISYHPQIRCEKFSAWSISLTCRLLSQVAQPHLYNKINDYNSYQLARTLFENPSLAKWPKEFGLGGRRGYNLQNAYTFLCQPGVVPPSCTRELHSDDADMINILLEESLLFRLTELETLSIMPSSIEVRTGTTSSSKLHRLFDPLRWRSFFRKHPSLPRLNKLTIEQPGHRLEPTEPFGQIYSILRCQTLRKLYIEIDGLILVPRDLPSLTSLKKLVIACETFVSYNFERLIQSCPRLEVLSFYSSGLRPELFFDFLPLVSPEGIVNVLYSRQATLRKLGLHVHHETDDDDILDEDDILNDLTPFTHLRKVHVDAHMTLDLSQEENEDFERTSFLHKLPRALEKLRIFNADRRLMHELMQIPDRRHVDFPNLNVLILDCYEDTLWDEREDDDYDCEKWVPRLEEALAAVGVKLKVV